MAVIQISKIQVRRGKKYSNIGVPQLSSGEFAWAVDSQELFIGNGAIAEGAPYVGNTKVLTEHDNIIQLLGSYKYSESDPSISGTVSRSLQEKLDEYVSVLDFGAVPDDFTDNTLAFQTAINQLFLNADPKYKKKLLVPTGVYAFAGNLTIPSTATIVGETQENTVLNFGGNDITFVSAAGTTVGNFSSSDHPQNIHISNITIQQTASDVLVTTGQFDISGVTDSTFKDIKFKSSYTLGEDISDTFSNIVWENDILGASTNNIDWIGCKFTFMPVAFRCIQTNPFSTSMTFEHCEWENCGQAVDVVGVTDMIFDWEFSGCSFKEIALEVFKAPLGDGVRFEECKFRNCSNNTNTAATPYTFMIDLGAGPTSVVSECSFDRQAAVAPITDADTPAITEVRGAGKVTISDRVRLDIDLADAARPLLPLSALNSQTYIDYVLTLGTSTRIGRITLMMEADRSDYSLSDNYQITQGNTDLEQFEFSVDLAINLPGYITDSSIDTATLLYKNPQAVGNTGTISFTVGYSV